MYIYMYWFGTLYQETSGSPVPETLATAPRFRFLPLWDEIEEIIVNVGMPRLHLSLEKNDWAIQGDKIGRIFLLWVVFLKITEVAHIFGQHC
jgi:hypothetical protein